MSFKWTLYIPPFKNDEELLNEIDDMVIVRRGFNNKQVLEAIEKMDVLFFPSRSEGFSMSIVECLKRGVVVIARDIPMGIPEIIHNNVNGIICKNDTEFNLAIQKFIDNPNEILAMKYNANRSANILFGYEKECKKLYDHIITTRKSYKKTFVKVKFTEPNLPEYFIRIFRFLKYGLFKKIWN